MRRWAGLALLLGSRAWAQAPDVRVNLDLVGSFSSVYRGPQTLDLYDPLGRTSTLQLGAYFENGLRAFVSERLQPISHDPAGDPFEQYFISNPKIWYLGKQFLPFGIGRLLHDNVLAGRFDTDLAFEKVAISVALCDGGAGRERGVTARIGGSYGISAAVGEHFGIAPTSLDLIRRPEDSPGAGHGWGRAIGLDGTHRSGTYVTRAEFVGLSRGATSTDPNLSVFDISCTDQTDRTHSVTIGWTHQMPDRAEFYRLQPSFKIGQNCFFEPMVRARDSKFYDLTLEFRFRL